MLHPAIIGISLQKCWAKTDTGVGMLIRCSGLSSSESSYRPRLGDAQNAKCVLYAESELLPQKTLRTNEFRPPALAAWLPVQTVRMSWGLGTAYIVNMFYFIRIVTWKEHWIGSLATLSLRRTVTLWSRWRITPMPTSFPRPSPKDLESRMDLEVSSLPEGLSEQLWPCPQLSTFSPPLPCIETFAIIPTWAHISSSPKRCIFPLFMATAIW